MAGTPPPSPPFPAASTESVTAVTGLAQQITDGVEGAWRAVAAAWRTASGGTAVEHGVGSGAGSGSGSLKPTAAAAPQSPPRPLVVALAAVAAVGAVGGALLVVWALRRRSARARLDRHPPSPSSLPSTSSTLSSLPPSDIKSASSQETTSTETTTTTTTTTMTATTTTTTMAAAPVPPPGFVSSPPLPLSCAIIALECERHHDHPTLPLRLEPLSEKTVNDLQVLNDSLYPVKYNRRLYEILLRSPKRTALVYYGSTLIGASSSRVEPLPQPDASDDGDSDDDDDESEEQPGDAGRKSDAAGADADAQNGSRRRLANYYIMTLGVLGPYRRKGVGRRLLRQVFDDCRAVEAEAAKQAEEVRRRRLLRRQRRAAHGDAEVDNNDNHGSDSDSESEDEEEEEAVRINDVYVHTASKSGREVEFYKRHGFHLSRIERQYYRQVEPPDALVYTINYAQHELDEQLLKDDQKKKKDEKKDEMKKEEKKMKKDDDAGLLGREVSSLKALAAAWVGRHGAGIEAARLAGLPADLRAWLLQHLTAHSLLDDALLVLLAPGPAASRLDLSWCRSVTEAGLQGVGQACPAIQELLLRGTNIRFSPAFLSVRGFPFVHSLNLDLCPELDDGDVAAIAAALGGGLRSLSLAGCLRVSDAGLKQVVAACPLLENLCLSGCDSLTDDALLLLSGLPRLQQLDVSWCRQLVNVNALSTCRQLSVLNLDGCWRVSGSRFAELCANVLLTVLSIDECGGIRRKHLSWCAENQRFAALRSLTLSGFSKLRDRELALLLKSADQLIHLVLWATDFSEELLKQLADAYPRLEIEAFSNGIDPQALLHP